jgi:hypothetical protein
MFAGHKSVLKFQVFRFPRWVLSTCWSSVGFWGPVTDECSDVRGECTASTAQRLILFHINVEVLSPSLST